MLSPLLRCWIARRRLQSLLDGELGTRHAEAIAGHLERCERCGLEATTLARVIDAIRQLSPALDPGTRARLAIAVHQLVEGRDGGAQPS